jgi:threonine synthase
VRPSTIAKSLAIGNPADGFYALEVVRRTGGAITAVSDPEIVEGIRLLARTEGIFGETAAGVTIASLCRLVEQGVVRSDERVVAYVTGHGLKTLDAIAPEGGPSATIAPTLDAFHEAFPETLVPKSVVPKSVVPKSVVEV